MWRIHRKLIEVSNGSLGSLSSMAKFMKEKFDKYWSDYSLILSCAAVLDPRFKLERVEYCYEKLYGELYAKEMIERVRSTLFNLFDEYQELHAGASPNLATSSGTRTINSVVGSGGDPVDELLEYQVFLSKKRKADNMKSDLKLYLEEKNPNVTEKCDVLSYWIKSMVRYPNLACMARDILTIPISTVPSESAFSMGKKLINPWRASLGEKIIEVLACYEDWLHSKGLKLGKLLIFLHLLFTLKPQKEIMCCISNDSMFSFEGSSNVFGYGEVWFEEEEEEEDEDDRVTIG